MSDTGFPWYSSLSKLSIPNTFDRGGFRAGRRRSRPGEFHGSERTSRTGTEPVRTAVVRRRDGGGTPGVGARSERSRNSDGVARPSGRARARPDRYGFARGRTTHPAGARNRPGTCGRQKPAYPAARPQARPGGDSLLHAGPAVSGLGGTRQGARGSRAVPGHLSPRPATRPAPGHSEQGTATKSA